MNLCPNKIYENVFDAFNMPKPEPILDPTREPTFIFNKIFTDHTIEGFTDTATLDDDYITIHAWHKMISPKVDLLLRSKINSSPSTKAWSDYPNLLVCTPSIITELATIIWDRYGDNWTKVYNALVKSDYDALENYNMIEKEIPDLSTKHRVSNDFEKRHAVESDVSVTNNNLTNEQDVNAFNTSAFVPASKNVASGSTQTTGDHTKNYATDTQVGYEEETQTGKRDLTRHGNIGVTTSQQMLMSELELRRNHYFRKILFESADSVLTVPYYIQGQTDVLLRYL